ncbi:hypothetical protein SLEP1_g48943 [Rubroshorea leprosula]|uniref:ribulose-phosphate 3-epimerase n=1 Tax=Rubroshorea leprosula TaxID=152421 RepID=A0AAV5LVF7_9ROSI|nr:hypothetical protein SLEP1_g48943 [Rubroshorea leprosula]
MINFPQLVCTWLSLRAANATISSFMLSSPPTVVKCLQLLLGVTFRSLGSQDKIWKIFIRATQGPRQHGSWGRVRVRRGSQNSGNELVFVQIPMGVEPKIAPSMLSSDFANLASEAERILNDGADWLHMDIMVIISPVDLNPSSVFESKTKPHFVPNLSIGAPVIESLGKHSKAYLDCHLMVTNPIDYVESLGKAGASGFTFHVEVSKENWQELIQRIKSKGMRPAVALKPGTPIEEVYPLVDSENPVEMVLVMTVEPGFGGQKFMPDMMEKVRVLRKKYPSLDIEVSPCFII